MCVTIVPLRVIFLACTLIAVWLYLYVCLIGVPRKDRLTKPFVLWRSRLLRFGVPKFARLLSVGLGFYSIEEKNRHLRTNDPHAAPIVIANHQSFTDPIVLFPSYLVSAVAAAENLRLPVIGTICEAIQTITVDRRDESSRHQVVESIIERSHWASLSDEEKIKRHGPDAANRWWPQICIFPEGTCTNGRALINFKPGAFVALKPVQPVLIRYHAEKYPNGRFHPCWVSAGPNGLVLGLRLLAEPVNYASLEYMEPMAPTTEEIQAVPHHSDGTASPSARTSDGITCFARRVRAAMADKLNVPVTEHSFLDVVLQDLANGRGRKQKRREDASDDATLKKRSHKVVGNTSISTQVREAPNVPSTPSAQTNPEAIPILTSDLEVSSLQRVFQVSFEKLEQHLDKFRRMDKNARGQVTYDEFLQFFDIDIAKEKGEGDRSSMRHLFELLDEDNSGTLDVREFLLGLTLISELKDNDLGVMKLAFSMFDTNDDGFIELSSLKRVFRRGFPNITDSEMEQAFRHIQDGTNANENPALFSDEAKLDFQQFEAFCKAHPECLGKFKETVFP